ncbi:MAG TPA: Gfo/Idh/MocA family oxidoreductase [Pirellulales bacterium]|nr:Gfo/Idh/MocA family oxidoreductase [Pirellulales bacterium]
MSPLKGTPTTERFSLDLEYLPKLPKQKRVPIGCIGAGFIMADCHLVAYRQAGFNPVAITSRTRVRARSVADRHGMAKVYETYRDLLADEEIEVIDIAVPPDAQFPIIKEAVKHKGHLRGILAQKPLGMNYEEARQIVALCRRAGITLAVNQNMRYDQSVRACKCLLDRGDLGEPVLATIDMRAIPHWMPWQERLGWVTLRIMSIHHLDTFRFWFGDPARVFASIRPDPRTARKFAHSDGICLYILEYADGRRAASTDDVWTGPALEGAEGDISIRWRVEGTAGMARGTIGWPDYPRRTPSTLDFTTLARPGYWFQPRWKEVWFPDAFVGPMAQLLCALEENREPEISGQDNLKTMALVEACYRSAAEHRAVALSEITGRRK